MRKINFKKISKHITQARVNLFILLSFVLFLLFSNNDSSFRSKIEYRNELRQIEKRIDDLRAEIKRDSVILRQIMVDNDYLERYSRENLLMCEPDEVIFRIDE